MSQIDEQLVEQWLNKNRFFTIQGLKTGNDEIDFLAIRMLSDGTFEYKQVEVQVSFRPIGFVCGLPLATRDRLEIARGVEAWIFKKFENPKKYKLRETYASRDVKWEYVLVHGEIKHEMEREAFLNSQVRLVPYSSVLAELAGNSSHVTSSPANGILEIVRYANKYTSP